MGYYDFEIDVEKILCTGGMVDEIFYLKDLKQRKLFLNTDICPETVEDLVKHILQYNREDSGLEIKDRKDRVGPQ